MSDHPGLALAAELEDPVLPLYIVEPELWAQSDASARQWAFVSEALAFLRADLAALGAPLVVRKGDAVEVLTYLHAKHGAARLISHEETGTAWTFARDKRVSAWAREARVPWTEVPQSGVVRRLKTRDGWAKARDAFMFAEIVPRPGVLRAVSIDDAGAIPDLSLGLCGITQRQRGGRAEAQTLLGGFLTERGREYRGAMSSPLTGETACSRLSPHFAWGTMSVREAVHATAARQREVRGTREGWIGSLKSFQARLAWRDHFMQKLEDFPQMATRCLHPAYEGLREDNLARRTAWEKGETGIPFVDACMRYLMATGWLNFRMRSMLMSFASYHLWLDWRATGPHLARMFTDYEPGIHWAQTQMQSGTTGINTVRMYNPVKQGHDQDPDGVFTRRWVPELAEVPDKVLQEPWRWEGKLDYPEPIIDLKAAAKEARDAIWAVRRGEGFRDEAQKVAQKHASRKDPRFVRDRTSKPKPEQLRLDL